MGAEIIHDDDIAGTERGHQELLDIGQEALAVNRSVEDAGRVDPIMAERGQEGQCAPPPARRLGQEPLALAAATMEARHVGLGPGLVDEDQTFGVDPPLIFLPAYPAARDIRPILLGRV